MSEKSKEQYVIGRHYTGKTSITNRREVPKGIKLTELLDDILKEKKKLGPCKRVTLRKDYI